MRKRWNGVAALAVGAAILGTGAVSAAQVDGASGGPRPSSALAVGRAGAERLADLAGIDDPTVAPGTIDDGEELLPLATIGLDEAIAAALTVGSAAVGEVDLEYDNGALVFNVDVGDQDVTVDAATGDVRGAASDD